MTKQSQQTNTRELKMPKMGESITEGTIISWIINEGEDFETGDILLEVATDKVDNEIPAPVSGSVSKILFKENTVVAVGETIAILEVSKESKSTATKSKPAATTPTTVLPHKENPINKTPDATPTEPLHSASATTYKTTNTNLFFSPLITAIAKQHHISFDELARIPATGTEGRLRKSDLFKYLNNGRPYKFALNSIEDPTVYRIPQLNLDKGEGKRVKMDRMRQLIADHMVYSKHTSPHVTAYVEADVTSLVNWRKTHKEVFKDKYNEKLTYTPLFVEAVAKAITDFPNINASLDGDTIIIKKAINIGIATALPTGNLIVPVIKDVDKKDLNTLASEVNQLASKARQGKLAGDDIKGGTFTISNVGTFGSLMGTPIINQPEVAILALGIIKKKAEVIETPKEDKIEIRSMMYLSLSFDHRVVDGYLGGSFLRRIADYLEQFNIERQI